MSVLRNLGDLQKEAEALGLNVVMTGKKPKKDDYVVALRTHYLSKQYPDGNIPKHLQFMVDLGTPMLCARIAELKELDAKYMWESPDVYAQLKLNGCRMIVIYSEDEGIHFYSRNISVKDFCPVEYDNIWLNKFDTKLLKEMGVHSFVLDCEILSPASKVSTLQTTLSSKGTLTETLLAAVSALLSLNKVDSLRVQETQGVQLEFHCFHMLELNGVSLMKTQLRDVLVVMGANLPRIQSAGLNVFNVPVVTTDKKEFYQDIVEGGGEGIILKRAETHYINTESRSHRAFVKVKRTVGESLMAHGFGDSVDAFVTGWERGDADAGFKDLIGDLLLSVNLKKEDGTTVEHVIAKISNLPLVERRAITIFDEAGNMQLRPDYMGKVGVVEGQCISSRAKRLVHPRLIEWRNDKGPEQCVFEESMLNKLIL